MTARQWRLELLHEAAFAAKIYVVAAVLGAVLVLVGAQFGVSFVRLSTMPQFKLPEQQELPDPAEHLPNDIKIPDSIPPNPVLLSGRSSQYPSQSQMANKLQKLQRLKEQDKRTSLFNTAAMTINSLEMTSELGLRDARQADDILDKIIGLATAQRETMRPGGQFDTKISQLLHLINKQFEYQSSTEQAVRFKVLTRRSIQLKAIQKEMATQFEMYTRFILDVEGQKQDLVVYFRLGSHERASSTISRSLKRLRALMKTDRALSEKARKALESLPG